MVNTPEMRTDTEEGAAAWASAAMGWNGVMKALTPKPVKRRAKAKVMVGLIPFTDKSPDICARFRVWHWPYTRAVPSSTKVDPREPTTRYLNAASRALGFHERNAVRATAAKVITSSMTKILNRSPDRTMPITPPASIRYSVKNRSGESSWVIYLKE